MRAEDFLQFEFDFGQSSSRKRLLASLLASVGNGYDWVNGELKYVLGDKDERKSRYVLKEPIVKAVPSSLSVMLYNDRLDTIKHMMQIDREATRIKYTNMYEDLTHPFKNVSKISLIYRVPEEINDDWLEICYETLEYMKEDGIDVYDIKLPR